MLRCSLTSRQQRYNTRIPKPQFFDSLISHLESFLHLRMSIQPFIYGYSCAFSVETIRFDALSTADHGAETVIEYQPLAEDQLLANRPYLIRAKQPGTYTFTLRQATIQPTEEARLNLPATDYDVNLCGNYGVLSVLSLKQHQAYVLEGQMLRPANETTPYLSSMRWYLSLTAKHSGHTLPAQIRLVKKHEGSVGILTIATAEGYGTLYTDCSYVMPKGVEGYVVTQANPDRKELTLELAYTGGETVPAHAPLLIKGEKRTYVLYAPSTSTADANSKLTGNLLQGNATTETTHAPDGEPDATYYFYKLRDC
jgi:hypothetical protein